MDEPASDEVIAFLSQAVGHHSSNAGRNDAPVSTSTVPREMTTSTFQAVNTQAVAGNSFTSVNGAAQGSNASPPQAAAVTQIAPQTAQTSSDASQHPKAPSQMDGVDEAMTGDNITYGTRSRNRAGNARPNYAEDQDGDLDSSAAAAAGTKKKAMNDAPGSSAPNTGEAKRVQEFAHLIGSRAGGTPSYANGPGGKESTPGTPAAASVPSKKRKVAAAPSIVTQTPPSASSPAPAAARKVVASSTMARETNIMTFTKHRSTLNKKGELTADDGTKLSVNDHVYLVCEPPGDPYYLCRIMEFLHVRSDDPSSPVDALRVNWYYRPRDIGRFNVDSRLLYATMHSDMCPLTSLRGKCQIKHRSEIEDLEAYRKERESFYFVQVFDRFIRRQYECIPVNQIINVPDRVKKALDERWKFVVVEIGRVKELTSEVKICKRCARYCASHDSVDCAICKNAYHMNCVQPPLPKKPSRGFAWACGPCSRASEKKLEARNTPTVSGDVTEAEEEEYAEEQEHRSASNDTTRAPSPSGYDMVIDNHPATQAEIAMAKMWPMRYLGIHCRVEDALQYDDRAIYPRASSRLGPRHQANVPMWHGRAVELVKPAEIKKRYTKSNTNKKEGKLTKETIAALEADREEKARRPKWVQDEPQGYIARGEDYDNDDPRNTARLLYKMPDPGATQHQFANDEQNVDDYLMRAKATARDIGVPPFGANFLDKALEIFTAHKFNKEASLKQLPGVHRVKDLHEPVLSKQELIKFEEGVAKYGSEHRLIRLHMKSSLPHSDIVRFYYLWKKTPKGREIWGNYGGRKGGSKQRLDNDAGALLQKSVANDGDDSAFDNEKAARRRKGFQCKFCHTNHSRQWRRAPGVSPGQTVTSDGKNGVEKGTKLLLALCLRCAGLWRKYAIQWEDIDEVAKKVAQGGGRAWKRKIDEELLRELLAANEAANSLGPEPATAAVPSIEGTGEPPKKKSKYDIPLTAEQLKKTQKPLPPPPPPPKEPTPPPPPIIPNQPVWKALPCAVCKAVGGTIECAHCKMTVHRQCFGLSETDGIRPDGQLKWICEQCSNDRNPQVSTDYACCMCLTEETLIDLVEPPKVSHKKKTDREREKERMEKELADVMRTEYRNKQLGKHRSPLPREPLKRTTGNNWVHVNCAVWTPEIRFSDAKKLEVAEGFQQIPQARHEAVCKLCKNKDHQNRFREDKGSCVSCFQCQCQANYHVSCAFEAGYVFGFDVTPVKGSRKDQVTTATLADETGSLTAGIWCKEHVVKSIIHPMNEVAEESGKTALQVFVEKYKQADLALTGTVRKAQLVQLTKDKGQQAAAQPSNSSRRESTANSIAAAVRRGARTSSAAETKSEGEDAASQTVEAPEVEARRRCIKCKIDVTPKWHPVEKAPPPKEPTPPTSPPRRMSMTLGEIADMERNRAGGESQPPQSEQPRQHIRFMPPGANGRAWQGMPDRYGPQPQTNGEPVGQGQPPGGQYMPPREDINAAVNGEVYHNHALPHYQNPIAAVVPPQPEPEKEEPQEFLCHKCFLKKKLDPTPPPEDRPPPAPAVPSPPRFPVPPGWYGPPAPAPAPPSQPTYENSPPVRNPWEDGHRPSQPSQPPPPVNGLGLSNYGQQAPPAPNYSAFGGPPQTPNGYPPQHNGPPSHAGPPPPMHERHTSFGYGGPPPSSGPPSYQQHGPPPRPSPIQGYPLPHQPAPNGLASPRSTQYHHPMQSPTHPSVPHYQGYGPRPTESPLSSHMPPLGAQAYSSPQTGRPEMATSHPQLPPQQPNQQYQQQQTSPQTTQARPDSQVGAPGTPRDTQGSGTPGFGPMGTGASASPNLRNLLS
ncbi:putative PHD type zinc finger protein with BAH domain-containing protein [Vermiconidia calcicola]|uniref:PHD type zinc finger protein with BAH domain-containing protein n=1 Tax=Vermiconidia calcicola TaxID=1690605 RepID=A0ACC3NHD9_9PEZI|nr:putative PHD type zinc finger protein with BAH domain-containing protein [Vermiconidia calcicola]